MEECAVVRPIKLPFSVQDDGEFSPMFRLCPRCSCPETAGRLPLEGGPGASRVEDTEKAGAFCSLEACLQTNRNEQPADEALCHGAASHEQGGGTRARMRCRLPPFDAGGSGEII